MRTRERIISPVPLPEGSLSHSGTLRWGWKVGNYEFCPLQPAAAREKDVGNLVGQPTTKKLEVLKRPDWESHAKALLRKHLWKLWMKLPGLQTLPEINTLSVALLWK